LSAKNRRFWLIAFLTPADQVLKLPIKCHIPMLA